MKTKIAYIDDSQMNLDCIELIFRNDFDTETFSNPDTFLKRFETQSYTSILLDIHMPKMDGFDLYEHIISSPHYNGCPILFISSDDSSESMIRSLNLGAVDFLSRQTSPEEMLARLKSKIKFFEKHRSIIEFAGLKVNLTLLKTCLGTKEIPLTFIELKLLCLVLRNYPEPVSKDIVIDSVWKNVHVTDANIHSHVFNLNSKLSEWDHEVSSVKGRGIKLAKRDDL
jgi:DNA-binding response OmpR family regulator